MLQLKWAAPLNLPVMWQWSLTFSSSLSLRFLQIQQMLFDWNPSSYFSFMIKNLLKCFFIVFLQYSYSLRIALINSQAAFLPLKTTIGLLNHHQYKQLCKQNCKKCVVDTFLCKNLHKFQHPFNYTQNQHKF